MNVIPAIDLKSGKCVRLYQGQFDQETEYSANPVAVAHDFASLGFRRLHVVDLDGARSGTQYNQEIVRQIAKDTDLEIQLGGGIRNEQTLAHWLDLGVSRCVIGSVAITDSASVRKWLASTGATRIVLALDVRIDENGMPRLATDGWTNTLNKTLWQCMDEYGDSGLQHVLCTDISCDGAMTGPNIDLYRGFISRYPHIHLQASGGVRSAADLQALREAGATAAITGRALLDGRISPTEISTFLPDA